MSEDVAIQDPALPVAVVADFQEIGTPEQIAQLYAALGEAQSEFGEIEKNKEVTIYPKDGKPAFKFRYAELVKSIEATRPGLRKHGLTLLQPFSSAPGSADLVRTILAHSGGGRIVSVNELPKWNDIKSMGGNITYLRRYAYNAILCLAADEDADENGEPAGSGGRQQAPQQQPRREEPRRTPPGPQNRSGGERSEARPTQGPNQAPSQTKASTSTMAPVAASAGTGSTPSTTENPPARNHSIGGGQTAAPTGLRDSASSAAVPNTATATPPSQPSAAGSPAPTTSGPASAGSTAPATSSEPGKLNEMQKNLLGQLARRAGATTVDEFTAMIRDICSALPLVNGMVPRANADNFEYICKQLKALEKPGA